MRVVNYKVILSGEIWKYTGDWEGGRPHGKGKASNVKGESYEGEWRAGVRNGEGRYSWNDGSVYEGCFDNGVIMGRGKMNWGNGNSYDGNWHNGKFHGEGRFRWKNGILFCGMFELGRRCGRGNLIADKLTLEERYGIDIPYASSDEISINGFWKSDKADGMILIKCKSYTLEGHYSRGKLEGFASIRKTEGLEYIGGFIDNKYNGYGKLFRKCKDGSSFTYEGEWKMGIREGHGILVSSDGSRFDGNWRKNCLENLVFCFKPSGRVVVGEFKKGNLVSVYKTYESFSDFCLAIKRTTTSFYPSPCACIDAALKCFCFLDGQSISLHEFVSYREVKGKKNNKKKRAGRKIMVKGLENLRFIPYTPTRYIR